MDLEGDPADSQRLRTPHGWERVRTVREQIAVQGRAPVMLEIHETSVGPVVYIEGQPAALQWVAVQAGAINLRFADLEGVQDLGAALAVATQSGIPAQNFVAGDTGGHIGWTIAGALPRRGDGTTGVLPAADHPRLVDPAGGQLWTATVEPISARAGLIRDRLRALPPRATQRQVTDIALDDEARFLAPWRDRLLRLLDGPALAGHPQRAEFRRLVEQGWTGHADIDA